MGRGIYSFPFSCICRVREVGVGEEASGGHVDGVILGHWRPVGNASSTLEALEALEAWSAVGDGMLSMTLTARVAVPGGNLKSKQQSVRII